MPQETFEKSTLEPNPIDPTSGSPLAELHGEPFPHFSSRPVTLLFEEQAANTPEAIAVTCGKESLTFSQLNARANQLARHLRGLGAGKESLVGISIDRSLDMAVAILGILKSGAGYLPLDPEYPHERLAFMLRDAQPALVLTKSHLQEKFSPQHGIVLIDESWDAILSHPGENLIDGPRLGSLMIYTSGSSR
jgi:non-ribosomal peptide synthetase component F